MHARNFEMIYVWRVQKNEVRKDFELEIELRRSCPVFCGVSTDSLRSVQIGLIADSALHRVQFVYR